MPNIRRVEGYCKAMKEANSKEFYIEGESFDEQNGYLETKLLLQAKQNITAIFTLSNTIALGCLKALKEEGIKVPGDISIITFDDAPYLDLLSTPLSSIAQPVSEISKIAIKLLQAKLNKNTLTHTQVLLKPKIIIRDSVRSV